MLLSGATRLALGARAELHLKTDFVGHGQCVVEGDRLDAETAHQQPRRGVTVQRVPCERGPHGERRRPGNLADRERSPEIEGQFVRQGDLTLPPPL